MKLHGTFEVACKVKVGTVYKIKVLSLHTYCISYISVFMPLLDSTSVS